MPKHISDELDSVKDLAKAAGFSLDLTEQIERLITTACKQARAELALSRGGSNVADS